MCVVGGPRKAGGGERKKGAKKKKKSSALVVAILSLAEIAYCMLLYHTFTHTRPGAYSRTSKGVPMIKHAKINNLDRNM